MKRPLTCLRERLTIFVPMEKNDGMGGQIISWAKKETVWAAVQTVCPAGRKPVYKIILRQGVVLEPSCRIKWRNKILKINSLPIEDARRMGIQCWAVPVMKTET